VFSKSLAELMTKRIYYHAYCAHNTSMVENGKANPFENIRAIVKDQNCLLSTSDLSRDGIPRPYLSII
jgi:hypothetical protein